MNVRNNLATTALRLYTKLKITNFDEIYLNGPTPNKYLARSFVVSILQFNGAVSVDGHKSVHSQ